MITDMQTAIIDTLNALNAETDKFYNETLPEMLSVKDGLVTLPHWFAARRIIAESGIFERNDNFLRYARANGFDVKMDMQSYKLSYHGIIKDGCYKDW